MRLFGKINKQYIFTALVILVCAIYSYFILHATPNASSKQASQQNTKTTQSTQSSKQKSISSSIMTVKSSLLMRTLHSNNQSGVVYKSPNVQIEYVATDDLFQAEILTTQITKAKQETENWFHLQGFNQEDICNLHLLFYLDSSIKQNMPANEQINLLPDGC